jgi:molybdopterin converting factor small subunit
VNVSVRTYGSLREVVGAKRPGDAVETNVAPGSTVADVAEHLGIPSGMVFLAMLDGEPCDLSAQVPERAEVTLMPPFTGG